MQHTLCEHKENVSFTGKNEPTDFVCINSALFDQVCFQFFWVSRRECQFCSELCQTHENIVQHVVSAVPIFKFGPIFSSNCGSVTTFKKFWGPVKKQVLSAQNSISGLFLHISSKKYISLGPDLFKCDEGNIILAIFLCDGQNDCSSEAKSSDESHCYCKRKEIPMFPCKVLLGDTAAVDCSDLYFKSHDGTCHAYIWNTNHFTAIQSTNHVLDNSKSFLCDNGSYISATLANDLQYDCAQTGNDEWQLLKMKTTPMIFHCSNQDNIPCRDGHSKCYNISQICVFSLDDFHHVLPCRTGEHLATCTHFECNSNFKCPKFYCIPWKYVCDGKWDCPYGMDEGKSTKCGYLRICKNLFQCRNSSICVHLADVCDSERDCPHEDDEKLCDRAIQSCPTKCLCLFSAVNCVGQNISFFSLQMELQRKVLVLRSCSLEQTNLGGEKVDQVVIFILSQSQLTDLCQLVYSCVHLLHSNCMSNNVRSLKKNCFSQLASLMFLNMSSNSLSTMTKNTFDNNKKLQVVDLSHNPITLFELNWIGSTSNLKFLYFNISSQNSKIISFEPDTFRNLNHLRMFFTNYNKLCCFLPDKAKCSSSLPWFLSCDNLLPDVSLKVLFYVLSVLILILNKVAIFLQIMWLKLKIQKESSNAIVIILVNVADFLLALPFFSLWIKDLMLKHTFVLHETEWRSGVVCHWIFCGFLFCSILSPSSLSFLSYQRLQIVKEPIATPYKQTQFVLKKSAVVLATTAAIAVCLTGLAKSNTVWLQSGLPTSLCSPFVDPMKSMITIPIILGLVFLSEFFCIAFTSVCYIKLFLTLNETSRITPQSTAKKRSNVLMVIQLISVTVSNILCWIPSSTVSVVATFMNQYPVKMITWTTITVVPINSVINPTIFVAVSLRKFLSSSKV